jgi:peptidoglycan-N-acetylglucosamine deacetylase
VIDGVLEGVVAHAGGERDRVCLTYDDGPGRSTRRVLDLLDERGARATFFMVGSEVERDPALAREVAGRGHEIGSHTMAHLDHYEVDARRAVADMLAGAAAIERVLGVEPALYRAPYGHFVPETVGEARRRGWRCVHWSALGMDWLEGETGRTVADRVLPDFGPGAIVLLHDSRRAKAMNPEPVVEATGILLGEAHRRRLEALAVGAALR